MEQQTTSDEQTVAAPVEFYGASWCGDCRRSKALLDSLGVAYAYHDVESSEQATERAREISGGTHIPVLQFADGAVQTEPSDVQLTEKLAELKLI